MKQVEEDFYDPVHCTECLFKVEDNSRGIGKNKYSCALGYRFFTKPHVCPYYEQRMGVIK